MRASDVIQALRASGSLFTPANADIAGLREKLAARTAGWSRPPQMPVEGTDWLQEMLTSIVNELAAGVRGQPFHDVLVDPARFGFAIEDLGSQYNARAFSIGDSWLVLVDETLITGLYLTVRAFAQRLGTQDVSTAPCESCGRLSCEEYSAATSARRWLEVGLCAHGTHQALDEWDPGEGRIYAANEIARLAVSFVVAHEIAHHVCGHFEQSLARLDASAAGESIHEFRTSAEMEMEADMLGCQLVLLAAAAAAKDDPNRFLNGPIGIEHVWCTFELLERTSPRPVSDDTHPLITLRRHGVDLVYAAKEGFEPVRRAVAGYRQLHHDLWRTLATPSPHDIACWTAERARVRSGVRDALTAMSRFAQQQRRAEYDAASNELKRLHSESSKLFFESAVAELASLAGPQSGLGGATLMVSETLCDLPHHLLLRLDHGAPFLGQRVDSPEIAFAEIFVPYRGDSTLAELEDLARQGAERGDGKPALNLGVYLERRGDEAGAIDAYHRGIELGDASAGYNLGLIRERRGEVTEAIVALERSDLAGHAKAACVLGDLLAKQGLDVPAAAAYRRGADRGHVPAHGHLGGLLKKRGDIQGAELAFQRGALLGDEEAMFMLGSLHSRHHDDPDTAETWLRRSAEAGCARAWFGLAVLRQERGDEQGAAEMYARGDARGDPASSYGLGLHLRDRGETDLALEALRRADDAGDEDAPCALGQLLALRGEMDEAESAYRRGGDRGDADALANLGNLLAARNDGAGALRAWLEGARLGDDELTERVVGMLSQAGVSPEKIRRLLSDGAHATPDVSGRG